MGLFDKKYCSVCGEKIGLLGNRKLADGNLCKECAGKLSPRFRERKTSTVAEIKEQLAYREANLEELKNFHPTRVIGEEWKVYIDEPGKRFVVALGTNFQDINPDIIRLEDVASCEPNITNYRNELKYKDQEGKMTSYDPPRYEYIYDFNVRIGVRNPYFDEILVKLNFASVKIISEPAKFGLNSFIRGNVDDVHPEYNPEYRHFQEMVDEVIQALMPRA